jgi:hypothetical protein
MKEAWEQPQELKDWRGHSRKCCNCDEEKGKDSFECRKLGFKVTVNWKIAVDKGSGKWAIYSVCFGCYSKKREEGTLSVLWDKCDAKMKQDSAFHVQRAAPNV